MELTALKQEYAATYLQLQSFAPKDAQQSARKDHLLTAGQLIGTAVNTGQRFAPMIANALSRLLGTDVTNAGAGIAATMALWIEAARSLMTNAGSQLSGFETAVSLLPWVLLLGGAALIYMGWRKHGKA